MTWRIRRRVLKTATGLTLTLGLACIASVGCVYDPDARCGPNQEVDKFDRCMCVPGTVDAPIGCEPCPAHELEQNGACVCESGYTRAEEGAACTVDAPGLGVACTASSECVTEPFTQCAEVDVDGYCTSTGCLTSEDCAGGYACNTDAEPAYCERPPTGQGAACESQDDCAGREASYCETISGHVCLVQGCTPGGDDCFRGWGCCDLTGFGLPTLCVPEGECPQ